MCNSGDEKFLKVSRKLFKLEPYLLVISLKARAGGVRGGFIWRENKSCPTDGAEAGLRSCVSGM